MSEECERFKDMMRSFLLHENLDWMLVKYFNNMLSVEAKTTIDAVSGRALWVKLYSKACNLIELTFKKDF